MAWDRLRIFHAVAAAGSFTKATRSLNTSQSAISRQIHLLEDELGLHLFKRVARGLILTEDGKALYEVASSVLIKISKAQTSIQDLKNHTRGRLRLAATTAFGSLWISPKIQQFIRQYPDIELSFFLKDDEIDLNLREADIWITPVLPGYSGMIHSDPASFRLHVYASRSYLQEHGTPQTAQDLDHHQLIVFGREMPHVYSNLNWLLKIGAQARRHPYLVLNNCQAIHEATAAGIGISSLPRYVVNDDPELVEILTDLPKVTFNQYIVYPAYLKTIKRAQVLIDFLTQELQGKEF